MNKTLKAFSVWCGITITYKAKFLSVTGTEKYWSDFIQLMFLRVCHFTDPVSKGTNIKCMKRQIWGILWSQIVIFFI